MFRTDIGRQILPVVVAHRGASASYPENTLASFQGAIDAGADIVELDVRLSADGVPVIMHNAEVDATTDGSGWVHELTVAELKRLDASRGRGSRAEIPTLEEAFRFLSGKAGINVEIKNMPGEPAFDSPREAAAEQVVILLDRIGFDGPMLVSSFNWLSIERVKELEPQVPTGFLTIGPFDPYACLVYARSRGHDYVLPQVPAVLDAGEAFTRAAHDDGVLVGTWVMDEPEGLERLFAIGVDAVATNDPATAVPIRDRFRARSD